MALITDQVKLNPKATGSLPSGTEGSLAYDSTVDALVSYGTAWAKVSKATAEGGTVTNYGSYKVHTFTADGTFSISGGTMAIDILLVGGGGASVGDNGGGGGSGGLVWKTNYTLSAGGYAIDVGNGATGGAGSSSPAAGGDSTLATSTFIAKGGGHGGSYSANGGDGGCGGGAGRNLGSPASIKGDTIQSSSGQAQGGTSIGYDGGAGRADSTGPGGGGGGTGAVGVDGVNGTVGNGGVGHSTFVGDATTTAALLWSAQAGTNASNAATSGLGSNPGTLYIGGGGSGGTQSRGSHPAGGVGGLGGGANMGASAGVNGQTNTGSGGSGTNWGSGTGGNGGSGIVIIRYAG